MLICENCSGNHFGKYGSGRFCKKECARSFSTKYKREEINEKVSKTLSGRKLSEDTKEKIREKWSTTDFREKRKLTLSKEVKSNNKTIKTTGTRHLTPIENMLTIDSQYSGRYIKERLFKEQIKDKKCEECGISSIYNDKPITLQLHHVNGIRNDHTLSNLQILCPNCHSQTDNHSGRGRSLRNS